MPVGLLAFALMTSSVARADDSASSRSSPAPLQAVDVLVLRNGAPIRGYIKELVPEDHVTMVLLDGATQDIAWKEIDRVAMGWTEEGLPSVALEGVDDKAGATATVDQPPPMTGPLIRVHVDSPQPVSLYRRPPTSSTWVHACTAPCDVELPLGDAYRVQGTSVRASNPFQVADQKERAVVLVDPSSFGGMVVGVVLMSAGGLAMFIGSLMVLDESERSRGAVVLTGGASSLIGGIVLYRISARTDVSQPSVNRNAMYRVPKTAAILDAFRRDAEWKGRVSQGVPPAPALPGLVPVLFERTF